MLKEISINVEFDKLGMHVKMTGVTNPNTNIAFNLPTNRRHGIKENTPSVQKKARKFIKETQKKWKKAQNKIRVLIQIYL